MEERREMNEQRMMTKEELESRVPRLNSILKERQEDFALEYTQKPVNNGMRRGYMFKNDSPISMAVYQREDWGLMSDAQLADLLVDLARQFDVKEKSEEIAKTVNGILTDKDVLIHAYPILVSEENADRFEDDGIVFDRFLDFLVVYKLELADSNGNTGSVLLHQNQLDTYKIDRYLLQKAAFENLFNHLTYRTLAVDEIGHKMVVVIREDGEIGGAAGMVHPAVYDKLIKIFGTDRLIFLPSSVREFIVIPQEGSDIEMLLAAVHDINRSSVIEQERLTDNIYLMQQESGIHSHSLEVIRP